MYSTDLGPSARAGIVAKQEIGILHGELSQKPHHTDAADFFKGYIKRQLSVVDKHHLQRVAFLAG
jgi:hypothetical protein